MKFLGLVLVILLFVSNSFAQSCEEGFAAGVNYHRTQCSYVWNPICNYTYREWIITYNANNRSLFINCVRTCPDQEPDYSGGGEVGFCEGNGTSIASKVATNFDLPTIQCGSVVHVENQVLGESIPLVGSNLKLNYFSNWQDGRLSEYTSKIPLTGNAVRDDVTSFDVKVEFNGSTVSTTNYINNSANIEFNFTWDGLDSSLNPTLGTRNYKFTVTENRPTITIPIVTEVNLGTFKAKLLGLGGWLPSNYVFYDSAGKKIYRADGSVRSVEAKAYGLTQLMVAEEDGSQVFIFDLQGRHLFTKTGLLGANIFSFNYDGSGRLSSIDEPFSRTTTFNRNISGVLTSITAPNGAVTSVTLDSNGYLSSVANPNSETFNMTYYGSKGLLHTFQKPGTQTSTFEYDSNGSLIKDSHSGGFFFELVKNINPDPYTTLDVSSTSAMGRVTQITGTGDATALNRTKIKPSSVQETSSYSNSVNSKSESWSRNGEYGTINYGPDDRFGGQAYYIQYFSTQDGAGIRSSNTTPTIALNDPNDPFSISSFSLVTQFNSSNKSLTTNYNPSTKKFSSSSYLGKTSEYSIDNYERVVSQKTGNLYSVDFTYTNENLTKIKQNTRETNLAYNSTTGLLQSVTNPLSQTTGFTYDSVGRVTAKTLPDSRVIGYTYDANGNVASIAPPGKPAHYFNLNSQELASSYAPPTLSGVSVINTTYSYNLDKQLTQITRPDGNTIDFNYNVTTGVLENFVTSEGIYNLYYAGTELPTNFYRPDGFFTGVQRAGTRIVGSTNYDASSNIISVYVPTFGNYSLVDSDAVQNSLGTSSSIAYLYNDDEDLKKAGDVNLTYNTPNGQLTGTTMGTGTTGFTDSYTYNTYGEVTGYQAKRGTTVIYDLTLTRDGMGRISGKSQTMNSITDAFVYTFDTTGRLTQTDKNSATVATYLYDDNSNRTGGVIGVQATTASYDNQDRLNTYNTLSFTYNANGDLVSKTNSTTSQTTQYVYDVLGNLKQVTLPGGTTTITYEIDGLNRRIGKRVNGTLQKRWVYMDQYRIAAELNASGTITKRFIYGSKGNIPDYMIASGVKYRIISDHLGSPRLVVKQSDGTITQRMNHDEYGRVTEDTNPGYLPFGFAGGLYDNQTSLVRFGARDYDPEIGRWTSKDPINFSGEDTNLFGYVENDPVNWSDMSGLVKDKPGQVVEGDPFKGGGGGPSGGTGGSANVVATVKPNGQLIGKAGSSSRIRVMPGGMSAAQNMYNGLCKGGSSMSSSTYPGQMVRFSDGGTVGLRPVSHSGPPSIDVNVPGMSIKIKFTGE